MIPKVHTKVGLRSMQVRLPFEKLFFRTLILPELIVFAKKTNFYINLEKNIND